MAPIELPKTLTVTSGRDEWTQSFVLTELGEAEWITPAKHMSRVKRHLLTVKNATSKYTHVDSDGETTEGSETVTLILQFSGGKTWDHLEEIIVEGDYGTEYLHCVEPDQDGDDFACELKIVADGETVVEGVHPV